MIRIPEAYTPPPTGVTPVGFLLWVIRKQRTTVVQGIVCDVVWLMGLALTPWAIGRAIDEGLVAGDSRAFMMWLAVVVWLQLQHSLIQGLRDRAGSINFSRAASRVQQVVVHAATRVTVAGDRSFGAGSVVTVASNDAWWFGYVPINVGTLVSALVSYLTVSVLLLRDSVLLGGLVIVVVPLFAMLQLVVVRALRERQDAARDAKRSMNTVATDSVRGLRVIRGVSGEGWFLDRFRERSERVRETLKRVATTNALADALSVLIAGALIVGLTWIGATLVARGELRVGELVAFYGYAGFMVLPVSLFNQVMRVVINGLVASRALVALLEVQPLWPEEPTGAELDLGCVPVLRDEATGIALQPGELLAVAIRDADEARAFVDRVGRLVADGPDTVLLYGRPFESLSEEQLRDRLTVSDPVPFLYSGTLREVLDPWQRHDDETILGAVAAVDASDIVTSVDGGFDALVGERGVEFSGGQRQRLGLARALLASTPVLVLHDPTSAVDASTEERMALGIRSSRRDAATLVVTTSPLVLSVADRVVVVNDGAVQTEGTHDELVRSDARYRAAVLRAEGDA